MGVLAGKLYQVQVEQGARYATLAESNRHQRPPDRPAARPHQWTGSASWSAATS